MGCSARVCSFIVSLRLANDFEEKLLIIILLKGIIAKVASLRRELLKLGLSMFFLKDFNICFYH